MLTDMQFSLYSVYAETIKLVFFYASTKSFMEQKS